MNHSHCSLAVVISWVPYGLVWSIYLYSWWRHQMETFSASLAICAVNSPVPGEFPHKGQWRGAMMFSLIYVWINDWVNDREAGDLRHYRAHYDVTVMSIEMFHWNGGNSKNDDSAGYNRPIIKQNKTRTVWQFLRNIYPDRLLNIEDTYKISAFLLPCLTLNTCLPSTIHYWKL